MALRLRVAILSGLLIGCWSQPAGNLHERVRIDPGDVVRIHLDLGMGMDRDESWLALTHHDADVVAVDARARGGPADSTRLDVTRNEGEVLVEGEVTGSFSWLYGGPIFEVDVRIPPGHDVEVTSNAGRVRISSLRGPLKVRALGAEVEISDTTGTVTLHSTHGNVLAIDNAGPLVVETVRADVRIERTAGAVEVTAGRGDIEVDGALGSVLARTDRGDVTVRRSAGDVQAKTGRGSILGDEIGGPIDARTDRGSIEVGFSGAPSGTLRTGRGSIRVRLPRDSGAELDARTNRGDVAIDAALPVDGVVEEKSAVGRLGGGGSIFQLRSSRGDIDIGPR